MTTINFFLTLLLFGLFGAVAHVVRAVTNAFPDRLSDRPLLDVLVSDGYGMDDHLLQVEFDDYGFYKLDSRRNLVISIVMSVLAGMIYVLADAATSYRVSGYIDWGMTAFWTYMKLRFGEISCEIGLC